MKDLTLVNVSVRWRELELGRELGSSLEIAKDLPWEIVMDKSLGKQTAAMLG